MPRPPRSARCAAKSTSAAGSVYRGVAALVPVAVALAVDEPLTAVVAACLVVVRGIGQHPMGHQGAIRAPAARCRYPRRPGQVPW